MSVTSESILSDALLQGCRQRAAGYDRDNKFCQEDFDELKAAGYLKLTLPKEFGGLGYTLNQYTREARRLASYAPATALCLNMHHYWVGTAADSWRAGDKSVGFILEEAGKGEVFAAGHAESGNETSIVLSATKAEKVPGGYKFTGRKSFGSLTPVWTRLGLHGMDTSDPANPKVVHGFLPRNTPGITIRRRGTSWACARRAATTPSSTARSCPTSTSSASFPAGLAGADFFILSIFAWALGGFGNVYYGLAQRMLELTIDHVKSKPSLDDGALAWRTIPTCSTASPRWSWGSKRSARSSNASPRTGRTACSIPTGRSRCRRRSTTPSRPRGRSPIARSRCRAASGCSRRARWSACSATRAPAASIRRTRRSRTS